MIVLAIDPGTTESGYALLDSSTRRPLQVGKVLNEELLALLTAPGLHRPDVVAIEMIASYGMSVGQEVFETCVWIGRFLQVAEDWLGAVVVRHKRLEVKVHHCHSAQASDANISQALVDRFAMGQPNRGKGTKAAPGWFYGFAKDIWQAYALGVMVADLDKNPGVNAR